MRHQCKYIAAVFVIFYHIAVAQVVVPIVPQKYCAKVEFTQLSFVSEFRGCFEPRYDNFIVKDYNPNFRPLRPTAKQYLTNSRVNSCAAYSKNIVFDPFTYVEAAIFLKSVRAEFIEIIVHDVEKNINYPLQHYGVGRWEIFNRRIQKNITNAQVFDFFSQVCFFIQKIELNFRLLDQNKGE